VTREVCRRPRYKAEYGNDYQRPVHGSFSHHFGLDHPVFCTFEAAFFGCDALRGRPNTASNPLNAH
jgi:hypothetical protein